MKHTKYIFKDDVVNAFSATEAFIIYCHQQIKAAKDCPLSASFKDEYDNEFNFSINSH